MIKYTYTPVQYNEDYVRKLKLERLMWKSSAMAAAHFAVNRKARAKRWASCMKSCKKELEK